MMHERATLLVPATIALAIVAQPAFAEEQEESDWLPGELSATVALTSDYLYRGISQTDRNPAIQGSMEYAVDTGLLGTKAYAGFWGSNVNFKDGDKAQLELDVLFGLRGDIGETGVTWDLGGLYYAYPGADKSGGQHLNYDFWEIPLKLGYDVNDMVSVGAFYSYSPDFFAGSGEGHYLGGQVTVKPPLPVSWFELALNGTVAYQWIEHNGRIGIDDYLNWNVGATVTVKKIDFTIAYSDTNLSQHECFSGTNLCDGRVVFTVGTSF